MMLKAILWLLVSRQSANTYAVYGERPDGETKPIHTVDCTQSARLQRAYITRWHGKQFLVFVDSNGEIEGECEVKHE